MMFSVLLSVISSLIAYLELSMALVHMNIVRQRIRNNFRQSLMSKDTRKATRRSQPYKQRRCWTRPGRTSAWWDNFVTEVVVAEEWRENLRMSRRNLSYLWHYLFAFYPVTSQVSRNLTKQGERNEILMNSWQ